MSKLILFFIFVLFKFCSSTNTVNITCEYNIISSGLLYIEGQQYECILQNDFPYFDGEIKNIFGDHKLDTDVTVLTISNKKIFEIPNLSSDFTGLKYINISSSSLKVLKKENIANFKETLEHLIIKYSNIEIIDKDVFADMTKLITIDLRNSKIFYIEFNQFSSLLNLKNFLLEGNECKDTQSEEDIKNFMVSATSFTTMSDFIQKLGSSTCGTLGTEKIINSYQNSRISYDLDAYEAEQNYDTLFDILTLNNEEIEFLGDQLTESNNNLTALIQTYQNSIAENEELQLKIKKIEEKTSDLEIQAENCKEVNGTCRFTTDATYGYSCIAHNININSVEQEISWTGTHQAGSTSKNINSLIIRYLVVNYMPKNIGLTFSNLKNLIIQSCGLKKLSSNDFVSLNKLENIQIISNEIASIEAGAFDDLESLKTLDLSENKIQKLPSNIFSQLKALTSLNLNSNELTALKSNFLPSTNQIQSFSAKDNKLTLIESAFVWRLRSAKLIDFSGNICDLKHDTENGGNYINFYNLILKRC